MIAALVIDWLLVALAFRRSQDARDYAGLAALAFAPGIQIPVILWLSVAAKEASTEAPGSAGARSTGGGGEAASDRAASRDGPAGLGPLYALPRLHSSPTLVLGLDRLWPLRRLAVGDRPDHGLSRQP